MSHMTFLFTFARTSDMATCSSKGCWKMCFFKEKHKGFSKNDTVQGSVTKNKVHNEYWEATKSLMTLEGRVGGTGVRSSLQEIGGRLNRVWLKEGRERPV